MEVNQMKKLIISVISTVMMIGAGVAFRSDQDVSVSTVEKSSKETTSVEKKKFKVINMKILTKRNQKQMKFRLRKKTQPIKVIQKKRAFLLAQKNNILKVTILQRVVRNLIQK